MIQDSPATGEEIPAWDVALEALLREEYLKLARPLAIGDFQRLSRQFVIRFDDLMYTLFELILHHRWQYRNEQGEPVAITREQVDHLRGGGRIEFADVRDFNGGWQPLV